MFKLRQLFIKNKTISAYWFGIACVCMVTAVGLVCQLKQSPLLKTYNIVVNGDDASVIKIVNNGVNSARFNVKVNNGFYLTHDDLLTQIKVTSQQTKEPLEKVAWRFISSLTLNGVPLTQNTWQHVPEVFTNSIGSGYCDDEAAVLASVWNSLGFTSRCWILEGHIVPEVYASGRWQMYDPSLKVFYRNDKGEVASVTELAENPDYVLRLPFSRASENPFSAAFANSEYIASLYQSTENNAILEFGCVQLNSGGQNAFTLPPSATLEFPGAFLESKTLKLQYAQAKLSIPSSWTGLVESPLVLEQISGTGKILLDSTEYVVGSSMLDSVLKNKDRFHNSFTLIQADSTIEVYYLINPLALSIADSNLIQLTGVGLKDLDICIDSSAANFDWRNSKSAMLYRLTQEDYHYYLQKYENMNDPFMLEEKPIYGQWTLIEKIKLYLDMDNRLSNSERKLLEKAMQKTVVLSEFSSNDSIEKTRMLNETKGLILVLSVMRRSSEAFVE